MVFTFSLRVILQLKIHICSRGGFSRGTVLEERLHID